MSDDLDGAYDYCQNVAKSEARNFYYAFRTLPARKRRAIYATYAFCRLCDDIVDEERPEIVKRDLIADIRRMLSGSRNAGVSDKVFIALKDTSNSFDIPISYFENIIDGVEMDLTYDRYDNFDDLRGYCYRVASTVGLICVEIFGYSDSKARDHAVDLGLAMQLTNIIRDLKEDVQRGRIYLPRDEMVRFGYSECELQSEVVNEQFRSLMRFQVDRARGYFDRGRFLISLLPVQSRACPAVLTGIYTSILDRIESADFDVFRGRIGLSKREKLLLTAKQWATSLISATYLLRK